MATQKKILVTGANGQLGTEFRELSSIYPQYEFLFLTKEDLSIEDNEALWERMVNEKPQYLINCAAYTAVDQAEKEEEKAFSINALAAAQLALACKHLNCLFVHISTDYVFDGNASVPYKETDEVNPQTVYGRTKQEGERLSIKANPDTIIIRSSWVYSTYGKNFVKTMIKLMSAKEELKVVNDQVGSPTYAADLAEAIMDIIESGHWVPGVYHFSNQGHVSWYEFALSIKEISGSSCKVQAIASSSWATAATRPQFSVLDTNKIREVYGIEISPWYESLRECMSKLDIQSGIN